MKPNINFQLIIGDAMKRLMMGGLLGVTMLLGTPAILPILAQRSYAQTSQTQAAQLQQLIDLAASRRLGATQ
ncbi:hypothetical protein H6G58_20075 [Arthrospira platensis FACHB-971]|nr:hypothetical protein AP285_09080 [Arthrospira platensis YZ]KDR57234.1 hypothetical protein APPUASWS_011950 [Arthrospira platensis str. Paraca]MBD2575232.1 hypothetical protein [Arthrospira platensis FACHB-971]MBD2672147.1 hypothetical protein [Arthrospira platensis FACHB-439]BAI89923.1 hypothetical protein NIES39_D05050 [Arthrospira platensis NIES-39]